jgi:hypothetical protein
MSNIFESMRKRRQNTAIGKMLQSMNVSIFDRRNNSATNKMLKSMHAPVNPKSDAHEISDDESGYTSSISDAESDPDPDYDLGYDSNNDLDYESDSTVVDLHAVKYESGDEAAKTGAAFGDAESIESQNAGQLFDDEPEDKAAREKRERQEWKKTLTPEQLKHAELDDELLDQLRQDEASLQGTAWASSIPANIQEYSAEYSQVIDLISTEWRAELSQLEKETLRAAHFGSENIDASTPSVAIYSLGKQMEKEYMDTYHSDKKPLSEDDVFKMNTSVEKMLMQELPVTYAAAEKQKKAAEALSKKQSSKPTGKVQTEVSKLEAIAQGMASEDVDRKIKASAQKYGLGAGAKPLSKEEAIAIKEKAIAIKEKARAIKEKAKAQQAIVTQEAINRAREAKRLGKSASSTSASKSEHLDSDADVDADAGESEEEAPKPTKGVSTRSQSSKAKAQAEKKSDNEEPDEEIQESNEETHVALDEMNTFEKSYLEYEKIQRARILKGNPSEKIAKKQIVILKRAINNVDKMTHSNLNKMVPNMKTSKRTTKTEVKAKTLTDRLKGIISSLEVKLEDYKKDR